MANTRAKGNTFERDVADAFTRAGFTVRGLESGGDHFAVGSNGRVIHIEAKRHERLRIPEWLAQQTRDCPAGMLRALVFRQARMPAYALVPFDQFVADQAALARLRAGGDDG